MCYINGLKVSLKDFIAYKQQQKELNELQISWMNKPAQRGFDYTDWPVIKPSVDGKDWDIVAMEWGYIPKHPINDEAALDFRRKYTTLNAIGKEILDKGKMYRSSAKNNRCLVLSSGFYEHRHLTVMGKRGKPLATPAKYPYHITVVDKPIFMMAGVWNDWTNKETGETKITFAIVTTEANELMRQVHNSKNRMPVIFTDELADEWTDPNLTETRIHELSTFQYPSNLMKAYPVAKDFLASLDPTEPIVYPELPDLILN